MRTLGELKTFIQDVFNDQSTTIATSIELYTKIAYTRLKRELNIPYDIKESTITTIASTAKYNLPKDYRMIVDVKVTVGGVDYFPMPVANRDQWNDLTSVDGTSTESDYPSFYFIRPEVGGASIEFYPSISSAGNTITVKYYTAPKDLASTDFTDYTTGTLTTVNDSTAIVGAGTTFAAAMADQELRVDEDGFWYDIASVTDGTNIVLNKNYEGLSGNTLSYKIGTILPIPPGGMEVLAYMVLQKLWEKREDFSIAGGKSSYYEDRAKKMLRRLKIDLEEQYDSPDVNSINRNTFPINPNDYPTGLG